MERCVLFHSIVVEVDCGILIPRANLDSADAVIPPVKLALKAVML